LVLMCASVSWAEPVQWTGNGHYYQYFSDELLTWQEAKVRAESLGGYLVTITSQEENDWITATFPSGQGILM